MKNLKLAIGNRQLAIFLIGNWKSAIMNKGLHRFSLLVAGATFFLIIAGALVTSNDAGLATEDWPLSNGQFFPEMVGNLFWEHGHRMVATTVGMLTIGLVIFLFFREQRRWGQQWRKDRTLQVRLPWM